MPKISEIRRKLKELTPFIAPGGADMQARVEQIPDKLIIECKMPIGVFVQEAVNIADIAQLDRRELAETRLRWEVVEELPRRIDYLQRCESQWWKTRFWIPPQQREFQLYEQKARLVFDKLLEEAKYGGEYNSDLEKAVRNLEEKKGRDFAQDIYNLLSIRTHFQDAFDGINSDPGLAEELGTYRDTYSPLAAKNQNYERKKSFVEIHRNKACTFLFIALEEIRRSAKYAFWNDKRRYKPYCSKYFRKTKE